MDLISLRTSDFVEKANRLAEPNELYEVCLDRLDAIFKVVKDIARMNYNSFYGFSLIPDGEDAVLQIRLGMLNIGDEFDELFSEATCFAITPIDEHFCVDIRFDGVFVKT